MENIELLKCPLCGSDASISVDPDAIKDTEGRLWAFTVVCGRCCASSGLCYSPEMAAKSWNTRKPMERIVEQLKSEKEKRK